MAKRGEAHQAEVLEVLRKRDVPVSAYGVLGELREDNPKIAPATVYRALSALMKRGRVRRLESLNAYVPCKCDSHEHASILSICDDCGAVEENVAPELLERLSRVIGKSGFAPLRHVIEIHGVCAACGTGRASA